jgi:hypothetical protein
MVALGRTVKESVGSHLTDILAVEVLRSFEFSRAKVLGEAYVTGANAAGGVVALRLQSCTCPPGTLSM